MRHGRLMAVAPALAGTAVAGVQLSREGQTVRLSLDDLAVAVAPGAVGPVTRGRKVEQGTGEWCFTVRFLSGSESVRDLAVELE